MQESESAIMNLRLPEWRNGRRGGLKNRCRKTCEFDSRLGHHSESEKPASKEVGFFFLRAYASVRTKAYVSARIPLQPRPRLQKEEIGFLLKLVSFEGSTIST